MAKSPSVNGVNGHYGHNGQANPQRVVPKSKGIMGSDYSRQKRRLMNLVNQIRSTGTALDVE